MNKSQCEQYHYFTTLRNKEWSTGTITPSRGYPKVCKMIESLKKKGTKKILMSSEYKILEPILKLKNIPIFSSVNEIAKAWSTNRVKASQIYKIKIDTLSLSEDEWIKFCRGATRNTRVSYSDWNDFFDEYKKEFDACKKEQKEKIRVTARRTRSAASGGKIHQTAQ